VNKKPKTALEQKLLSWKEAIGRAASAAADIAEGFPCLFPATHPGDHAQGPCSLAGFTWADFMQFDAEKLEIFRDDLADLKEQADRALEAFEEVLEARSLPF
jgi:hypothetical protein